MQRHTDRVTLVMAGALGIGAACSERLAAEGAKVVVADINLAEAEATAQRSVEAGGQATAMQYDQGDENSVVDLIKRTVAHYGGLDALHCNAAALDVGRSGNDGAITAMNTAAWEKSFRLNATNHAVASREAIPHMLARGQGSIVYTSSDMGAMALPFLPAYAASKAAMATLARHVCVAHGKQGIRANAISPGQIVTPRSMAFDADKQDKPGVKDMAAVSEGVNCPRLGRPEDVAALVAFLLSDEAGYINGQTISINGGSYCRI